jgi:hypothetical protein
MADEEGADARQSLPGSDLEDIDIERGDPDEVSQLTGEGGRPFNHGEPDAASTDLQQARWFEPQRHVTKEQEAGAADALYNLYLRSLEAEGKPPPRRAGDDLGPTPEWGHILDLPELSGLTRDQLVNVLLAAAAGGAAAADPPEFDEAEAEARLAVNRLRRSAGAHDFREAESVARKLALVPPAYAARMLGYHKLPPLNPVQQAWANRLARNFERAREGLAARGGAPPDEGPGNAASP